MVSRLREGVLYCILKKREKQLYYFVNKRILGASKLMLESISTSFLNKRIILSGLKRRRRME